MFHLQAMDRKLQTFFIIPLSCLLLLNSIAFCELDEEFYDDSCPNLTQIVHYGVWSAIKKETRMAASLLRLHFHDCFVNGCDGSILLDDTSAVKGEKGAMANRNSARGFEVIDSIKAKVEKACPSTVSCADILALAARDAVSLTGGPFWVVPLGRRDGTIASLSAANDQIPSPLDSIGNMTARFTSKGLEMKDVVVLSGAHTIGFAQCFTFKRRLFDFDGSGKPDPALASSLLGDLQSLCPNQAASDGNLAPLDPVTVNKFDNVYYKNLVNGSGVLQSDQALMQDSRSASMVNNYGKYPYQFKRDFGESMVKMGNIGVLSGKDGQIRKNCRVVN